MTNLFNIAFALIFMILTPCVPLSNGAVPLFGYFMFERGKRTREGAPPPPSQTPLSSQKYECIFIRASGWKGKKG
jgi:hypothetical protein